MEALDYTSLLDDRGAIRSERVDDLMVEVVSGKFLFVVGGRVLASRTPTPQEADTARLVYVRTVGECVAMGLYTRSELEKLALETGDLDRRDRVERAALEKRIAQLAKSRDQTPDGATRIHLANQMQECHERLRPLLLAEEAVFRHSAEARGEIARGNYLTFCCTTGGYLLDEPVWSTWKDFQECADTELLIESHQAQVRVSLGLPVSIIRALARHPAWRERWLAARDSRASVFEGPSASWDRNKLALVSWSEFFDSVLRHPELPDEKLIHDDKLLDRWVSEQVAKTKAQRGKHAKHGSHSPVTYLDGQGRRKEMHLVDRKTTNIGQPYKIRG